MPRSDQRSQGRSNVFLTAVLDSGIGRSAVRIRNLSATGALIEGSALPPVGTAVRVLRGDLSACGTLAWADRGHAGISFAAEIDVAAWVRRHNGQQRVDGVIVALRSSAPLLDHRKGGASADSLPEISAALDKLCDDLAANSGMSIELGEQLVRLDSIAQALRQIASGKPS